MNRLSFFTAFLLAILPSIISAQDYATMMHYAKLQEYVSGTNGIHNLLMNGRAYENIYSTAIGHPFFLKDEFESMDIRYNNTWFKEQKIKYDLYEQKLLLDPSLESFDKYIILPVELVDEFRFSRFLFRRYNFFKGDPSYYQVVAETDSLQCLYKWSKRREESTHMVHFLSYKFGEETVKKYINFRGNVIQVKSNKSFIRVFPYDIQQEIKNYLKARKIKVKRAADSKMSDVITFCQETLEGSIE